MSSSLAFILNPLDHNNISSSSSTSPAPSLPASPRATTTIAPRTATKRALPRLAAAIAPQPPPSLSALFANWPIASSSSSAFESQLLLQLHQSLAPLPPFGQQQQAITPTLIHKKQRRLCVQLPHTDADIPENDGAASPTTSSEGEQSSADDATALTPSNKKTRLCKEAGCTSLAVSRRSCVRHGGGSRCTFSGCLNGAKLRNRCFQHGGSTICLADGCASKAKRYGYCWSHGGGRICSATGCIKVAAQGGLCWAHGGGNRCKLDGCSKRSYQKHGYYCKAHANHNS